MKRTETRKQFTLDWDSEIVCDFATVDMRPEEGLLYVSRRGHPPTTPENTLDFGSPADLEAFAKELQKAAAEMAKWPIHKEASK